MIEKKKVFVIGSYGAGNIGDEAILESIKKSLGDKLDLKIAVPHLPYSIFNIPFRLRALYNLWKCDFVILGGGGLFTDSDSIKAIKIWGNCVNYCKLFGKRIFLYGNSIGPFSSARAENLAKKYLKKIDYVSVRDRFSQKILKDFGIESEVFGDPAFLFKNDFESFEKPKKKIVAVSIRGIAGNFNHKIFEKKLKSFQEKGYLIYFIGMEERDLRVFSKAYSLKNIISIFPKHYSELLEILSEVEFCIGMRLHFLIAGIILGKKVLGISYSPKVKSVLEKFGVKCLELGDFDFDLKDCEIGKGLERERDLVEKMNKKVLEF